jgi:hypothetical protein
MEQSDRRLQTIIPSDEYFKQVNCASVLKGFIVLKGNSRKRQIERQARKYALGKHEYFKLRFCMLWDSRAFSVSSVSALVKETYEGERRKGERERQRGRGQSVGANRGLYSSR